MSWQAEFIGILYSHIAFGVFTLCCLGQDGGDQRLCKQCLSRVDPAAPRHSCAQLRSEPRVSEAKWRQVTAITSLHAIGCNMLYWGEVAVNMKQDEVGQTRQR